MKDILLLCEGNPGAISVIKQMIKENILTSQLLDIMKNNNIVSSKIWIKYKECNQDIYEYKKYLLSL